MPLMGYNCTSHPQVVVGVSLILYKTFVRAINDRLIAEKLHRFIVFHHTVCIPFPAVLEFNVIKTEFPY